MLHSKNSTSGPPISNIVNGSCVSSETARRDRGPVELSEEGRPVHGREVGRAAVLARRESAAPVKVAAEPPVARERPGSTR